MNGKNLRTRRLLIFMTIIFTLFSACREPQQKDQRIKLKTSGRLETMSSPDIEGSFWGIQAGSLSDSILEKASQLGVKWTRLQAKWEKIESEEGSYDWTETDEAFDAVLKYGITPFVTIGNGNAIYSGTGSYDDPKLAAIYGTSPAPPVVNEESMKAWLDFVTAAVERYKDRIIYWEIWNEPNHRKFWGAPPNAADYGRLVKVTAEKIRKLQPGAKIIAGSMAGLDKDYADQFLSACDPGNLDIISFHNYSALPEERMYLFPGYYEVIVKHNPQLEIWQGECGYPSHSRTTGFRGRAPWGLNIQAKWLLRQSFVDTYFCHATLSNYFILFSDGNPDPEPRTTVLTGIDTILGYPERGGNRLYSEGVNQKCILFRKDAEPKPAYKAYQNLCSVFDHSYRRFATEYNIQVVDPGIFYGIGKDEDSFPSVPVLAGYKTKENNSLIAYWLPWNPQENLSEFATVEMSIFNHHLKNPVLVDPLTGELYEISNFENKEGNTIFKDLPLADYPLIIVENEALPVNPS